MRGRLKSIIGLLLCLLAACTAPAKRDIRPVETPALEWSHAAQLAQRAGAWDEAKEHWDSAVNADPSWSFPRRALQLLAMGDRRGPGVLSQARQDHGDGLPGSAYLLARLGQNNGAAYRTALATNSGDAWLHHGLAIALMAQGGQGRWEQSLRETLLSVELARTPMERVLFLRQWVRILLVRDNRQGPSQAFDGLVRHWQELDAASLAWLDLSFLLLEQTVRGDRRAWQKALGLRLHGDPRLTRAERKTLASQLGKGAFAKDAFVKQALAQASSGAASPAAGVTSSFSADFNQPKTLSTARAYFIGSLPPQALDGDGRPRDPRLNHLDRCLGQLEVGITGEGLVALGKAFLEAGHPSWAKSVAETLHRSQAPEAQNLSALARLMESTQGALARALDDLVVGNLERALDLDAPPQSAGRRDFNSFQVDKDTGDMDLILESLERRLAPLALVEQASGVVLGWDLAGSPRIDLWPFLTGVAAADGEGATLRGLGQFARSIGFYVQITAPTGQRTETRLARLLLQEAAHGKLLGRPWHGTRILLGETQGSRHSWGISGSALPTQYWVLVPEIVRQRNKYDSLAARFRGRPKALASALAQTGLLPTTGLEVTSIRPGLGEADRVALAVMAQQDGSLVVPSLEDLLDLTMRHEEAHMADFEEWLAPPKDVLSILGLLWDGGLGVRGVWALVEARAQLVALCVIDDPRLALAQMLRLVEQRERIRGTTSYPHAEGYARILKKLLVELQRNPRGLDPSRSLLHQLHLLGPEDLRSAGLVLAEDYSLIAH